jgi:hypothetical protein
MWRRKGGMMEYTLKDAVKLTDKCCDKRGLWLYYIETGTQIGDESTHWLVCDNCRTDHFWHEGDSRVVVCGGKVAEQDIYDKMAHSLFWMDGLIKAPDYVDKFCDALGLDKNKVHQILSKNVSN